MKSRSKLIIVIAVVVCAAFIVGFVLSIGGKTKNESKFTVACNVPMTGDLSFYGEYISNGVYMAMDELKDSMAMNEMEIVYDFQDNAGVAKDAVSAYNRQKINGFDIYVSGVTNQTMAILDLVKATNKPHFIYSFDPFLIEKGDNLYRPYLDMEYEGKCMIDYMKAQQPKNVAFVYQNITSTQTQMGKFLKPFAESNGIEVVLDECYDVSVTDFKNIVLKVKQANPDMIIMYGFQNQLAEIIKGFNSNEIKKEGNLVCSFDFLDVQTVLEPELLDGIVTNVPQYVIDNADRILKWKEAFHKKYNREPLFTDAYAYDMAYTIYYALKLQKANPELSFEDCVGAVEFDGITGHVKYLETGQQEYNVKPCIFKNNSFVPIEAQEAVQEVVEEQ